MYEKFTTPPALIPGSYSLNITGTAPANAPTLWNTSATYNDAWANTTGTITPGNIYVGQYILAGDYTILRSYLMFDTSTIPDLATITSGYVRMVVFDDQSTDDFNVTLQEVKSPKPHDPLIPTDYSKAGIAGHLGHTNTTGYADESIFNISLTVSGRASINKTGMTKWSVRSNKDINASSPAAFEFMIFYDYGVDIAKYPKLFLNYTVPNLYWQNIVNLTWLSNSSGAWVQYNRTHVTSNGTTTVPAINFSGVGTYNWHLEWESNHTNNGSSQIFTFTTVNASGGMVLINRDRTSMVWLLLGFIMAVMIYFGIKGKKKRNEGNGE